MLSNPLKSLKKLIIHKTTAAELPHEIRMALSFIQSGWLATSLNDNTVFVFKGSPDEIESLKKTSRIKFGFECMKRPEFPSVRMYFDLRDNSNKPCHYDYFFNSESDEEIKLLRKLEEQNYFEILFFDSRILHSSRIKLTKKDKEKIKEVLDEIAI